MKPDNWQIFFMIIQQSLGGLILLGASIYYLIRKKNISGALMVLGLAVSQGFFMLSQLTMFDASPSFASHIAKMKTYSSITYFSNFLFVAGFVMLIINITKKDEYPYELTDNTKTGNGE